MLLDASQSQLVLVDYQSRLMPAIFEGDAAAANALRLAKIAALVDVPTWGTEQNPSKLGENPAELRALCRRTLAKMHFSGVEEGLGEWLRAPAKAPQGNARSLPKHLQKPAAAEERNTIVVAGCEAHVCLLQTALGLLGAGRDVYVVENASGSRRPSDHAAAMRRLAQAGATVVTHEMVLFEWLHDCRHPRFREVLALIKAES